MKPKITTNGVNIIVEHRDVSLMVKLNSSGTAYFGKTDLIEAAEFFLKLARKHFGDYE